MVSKCDCIESKRGKGAIKRISNPRLDILLCAECNKVLGIELNNASPSCWEGAPSTKKERDPEKKYKNT